MPPKRRVLAEPTHSAKAYFLALPAPFPGADLEGRLRVEGGASDWILTPERLAFGCAHPLIPSRFGGTSKACPELAEGNTPVGAAVLRLLERPSRRAFGAPQDEAESAASFRPRILDRFDPLKICQSIIPNFRILCYHPTFPEK
jgi:hypothetical protein